MRMGPSVAQAACVVTASGAVLLLQVAYVQEVGEARGATVKVEARFPDGSSPSAETTRCYLICPNKAQRQADSQAWTRADVEVTGSGGDWTFGGVGEGLWPIRLTGPGFAQTSYLNRQVLYVFAQEPPADQPMPTYLRNCDVTTVLIGEAMTLKLTLVRGGTITGRVTAAEDERPLAGATVRLAPVVESIPGGVEHLDQTVFTVSLPHRAPTKTDAGGRYSFTNVPPGRTRVYAEADARAEAGTEYFTIGDGETRDPGIQLERGGRIAGRVVLPEGAPAWDDLNCLITSNAEGGGGRPAFSTGEEGEFRTEPLLPGHYSLHARAQTRKGFRGREVLRWSGDVGAVNVLADEETADIIIRMTPEKE